jgi:hypothetical protein
MASWDGTNGGSGWTFALNSADIAPKRSSDGDLQAQTKNVLKGMGLQLTPRSDKDHDANSGNDISGGNIVPNPPSW